MRTLILLAISWLASANWAAAQPVLSPLNIFGPGQRYVFDTVRVGEELCVPLLFQNNGEAPVIVDAYSAMWSWDTSRFVVRDRHRLPDTLAPGEVLTMGTMCFHPKGGSRREDSVDYEMTYDLNGERGSNMFKFHAFIASASGVTDRAIQDVRVTTRGKQFVISAASPCQVEVLDLLGRVCLTADVQSERTSQTLLSGTYIVRISRDGVRQSIKTQIF